MAKKQQMQWTEPGTHHLLQVRTKVLNDQLRETFVCWYPGMQTTRRRLRSRLRSPGLKCSPVTRRSIFMILRCSLNSKPPEATSCSSTNPAQLKRPAAIDRH
jgi:hypothetical protein